MYSSYPKSVNDRYIEYQFYDSIQGLCSYLRGVVSTSAVLSAAGVGDSEATAMSAAVVSTNLYIYIYIYIMCVCVHIYLKCCTRYCIIYASTGI